MALPSTHAASGAEELPEGGSGEDEALPSFLSAHSLGHLTSALQGLSLQALLAPDDRLSLLSLLQSLGTLALRDRQALANAVSRERRRRGAPLASRGKAADPPPPPAGKSPPPAAPAAPAAPPPPPPPPPRAVPSDFTAAEGSEAWRRAPSEPTRQAVCRCVLSELSHYEVREGQVRLAGARRPLLSRWMGALAECADPLCGCYRLARRGPRERPARVRFRELVVECVARAAAGGGAVRYVTLGSGGLLTDFEILCGLYDRGLRVEAVVAVDRAYTGSNPALRQIATFFSPARVTSFSSVVELERAAREAPELYGRATALVQCDSPISRSICQSAAACVLSEGGLAFKMDNGADCCAKAECWRRARLASGGLEDVPIQPMLQHYGPRRPPLSAAELASLCGTRLFTVLHHPAVVLRASPAVSAPVVDSRRKGEQVLVDEVCDGWLKISKEDALLLNPSVIAAQEEKWLLRDGSSLGFGLLASEELCRPLY